MLNEGIEQMAATEAAQADYMRAFNDGHARYDLDASGHDDLLSQFERARLLGHALAAGRLLAHDPRPDLQHYQTG